MSIDLVKKFKETAEATAMDFSVGNRFGVGNRRARYLNNAVSPTVGGMNAGRMVSVGQRAAPAQLPDASAQAGGDPVSPYGGNCLAGMSGCEYDPAEFCGWSILPFSTLKTQGSTPGVDQGPVQSGVTRIIRVTSERACQFRVRGLWMRGVVADDGSAQPDLPQQVLVGPTGATIAPVALSNVTINNVPRVVEIGSENANQRVFIPTDLFDGTFWVLPVDWGVLSPINNTARPLELSFNNFTGSGAGEPGGPLHVFGCLFGDVIGNASGTPAGLQY